MTVIINEFIPYYINLKYVHCVFEEKSSKVRPTNCNFNKVTDCQKNIIALNDGTYSPKALFTLGVSKIIFFSLVNLQEYSLTES